MNHHGMDLDLIVRVERELRLAEFERRRRLGLFERAPRRDGARAPGRRRG